MDFKNLLQGFAKVGLPLLGAALPVPGGAALGVALAGMLNLPADAGADGILAAVQASPEAREKAIEFQATHQETMLRITVDADQALAKVDADDRASARISSVQGGTQRSLFWLSLFLLTLSLGGELAVLWLGYPKTLPDMVVGRVLGLLDSVTLMVLTYWYGSSHGSAVKTQMLDPR